MHKAEPQYQFSDVHENIKKYYYNSICRLFLCVAIEKRIIVNTLFEFYCYVINLPFCLLHIS